MSATLTEKAFGRFFQSQAGDMTPEVARWIAGLRANNEMQDRYDELADKNTEGTLTPEEREELEDIVQTAEVIALLNIEAQDVLARSNGSS